MFGLMKRSTHEAEMFAMSEALAAATAEAKALKLEISGYEAASRLNRQRRQDAEHTAKVLCEALAGKVDQVTHYREVLQEIRGMATPACAHIGKRMAAKAEYALQTYACVQAEAA